MSGRHLDIEKRITCLSMIRAGCEITTIITAVHCFLNTVKTIRREMDSCNGDYDAEAFRKEHSRRSHCLCTLEIIQQLQEKMIEDSSTGMRSLPRKMSVAVSTMKLNLNKEIGYQSYYRCNSQLLTDVSWEKRQSNFCSR